VEKNLQTVSLFNNSSYPHEARSSEDSSYQANLTADRKLNELANSIEEND
jgi:hypothetical protein